MDARLTIYLSPENRESVTREVELLTGKTLVFFSANNKFLSWIGESDIVVASPEEGFILERQILLIDGIIDAEVIPEETNEEDAINERFSLLNTVIRFSKV